MNWSWCSQFDSGNCLEIEQIKRPKFITDKSLQSLPNNESIFFNLYNDYDNGNSTFRSYFNFLIRPTTTNYPNCSISDFYALPPTTLQEPKNLIFIWKTPPKPSRLINNLFRPSFRVLPQKTRREYYKFPEIHDKIIKELRELDERLIPVNELLPDYQQVPFQIASQAVQSVDDDDEKVVIFAVNASQLTQISYSAPYPLSHIYYKFIGIKQLSNAFPAKIRVTQKTIGHTLENLPILSFSLSSNHNLPPLALTARSHPGETLSSFLVDQFVISAVNYKIPVLDHFQLLIIPCLNPDGVYLGNYRSDSLSQNLNRTYDQTGKNYPVNQAIIKILHSTNPLILIDFHNHASILSAVLFGNDILTDAKTQNLDLKTPSNLQILNLFFCKTIAKSAYFNTSKCDFSYNSMDKTDGKGEGFDGTLRVFAHRNCGIPFCFTLETHYFCYENMGKKYFWHVKEHCEIGEEIARGVCGFMVMTHFKDFLSKIMRFLPAGIEIKKRVKEGKIEEGEVKIELKRLREGQLKEEAQGE